MFIEYYCVPNIILGAGDKAVNKVAKTPDLVELIFWWGMADNKQVSAIEKNKAERGEYRVLTGLNFI